MSEHELAKELMAAYRLCASLWPEDSVWLSPVPEANGWAWTATSEDGGSVYDGPVGGSLSEALDLFVVDLRERSSE